MRSVGLVALAACQPPAPQGAADTASVAFCESTLQQVYDPATALSTWPDDHWTVPDADTPTGLRLAPDPDHPALSWVPENYREVVQDMAVLDGFGTTPELYVTLGGALPADLAGFETVLLTQGQDGAWTAHDHARWLSGDRETLFVRPWRPLPPASRGVFAVRAERTDGGPCLSPAPALRAQLTDTSASLHERYADGLDGLAWSAEDVGAMTVFTTQSIGSQDAEVLAEVDTRSLSLDAPMDCPGGDGTTRRCEGTVTVADYRDETTGVVPTGAPIAVRETHAVPVSLWLPDDAGAGAPYPVLLCGHGLAGSRDHCRYAARVAGPLGWAVLGADAIEHGDHPDRTQDGSALEITMALCGFTLTPPSLSPLVLRDNFRQSVWDRLQVLRAVQAGWDVDGDGVDDLDGERVAYTGVSLGGIMAPQLLTMAPEIESATLLIAGGGFFDLFLDSSSLGLVGTAMTPADWDDDDLARMVPLLQTLVDAADPLVYAAALSERRRAGELQAHISLLMAHEDSIVPNRSTTRLTQALELETVGQALIEIDGVAAVPGPVTGNLPDGATGGLWQLDRVQSEAGGEWGPVDHLNVHDSEHVVEALGAFLMAEGTPTLPDPYARP